ncbi:EEP domain-containing protein [Neorhizobium lilium]|uniref:EEP domain-containing protein n=1 Tax=Neorhizobium lilium TaxID=2503024 RepID=A0A444LJX4_9HYPH|nr:endonuclease/exonuclease/phosphatase family protein [Neorhizobium lilium]RWX79294.1 EEP domain-containing protein [Neorhizobium lilium]
MNDLTPVGSLSPRRLKILTYNVHSCIGTDRKLDPARIADVIAALEPDVIGLQELDVGRNRTGGTDQAHEIATLLRMEYHFHAALNLAEERYGDAILTTLPAKMIKADVLPSFGEQRGALAVELSVGDRSVQIVNTHLGLRSRDRRAQMAALLGEDWLSQPAWSCKPRILIGDLNSTPLTRTYKSLAAVYRDAHAAGHPRPRATFPSRFPLLRLDHVFISPDVKAVDAQVVSTPLARLASDHLPLLVTVEV